MKPSTNEALRTIAIVALAVGVLLFLFFLSVRVNALLASLDTLAHTSNEAMLNVRDTAASARAASDEAAAAAKEQRAYWAKTSAETYKTMASVRLSIVRTDHSWNDVLAPRIASNLDATQTLSAQAAARLNDTMDEIKPSLVNLARASASAADGAQSAAATLAEADPALRESLAHVDRASANVEAMSADTKQMTADVAAFVHRETTPVRGTWNVIRSFLEHFAGPAAQVATAAK